ncbi:hypothetical protein [Tenggerimyces flavus]|uniref:Uncharacterized protein n=1 Tax=Tenggerimyces flavus TaxID=1708749 RepID=A0ABV7YF57_9ACTN|nr:hypothetical protein [Tenggerimyces flavus]MBM7787910.1 hypothetical protein [Tenggerimyces flavus]
MRFRLVPWAMSLVIVGAFSGVAAATPSPKADVVVTDQKVDKPVDESDPAVIQARKHQQFVNDLGALVEQNPRIYAALMARPAGRYEVLIKSGANRSAAVRAVVELVARSGRPIDSVTVTAAAPRSRAELLALHARVDALLDELHAAGADIVGTGPDFQLGKIQIDIVSGQDVAERVLGPLVDDVHFVQSVITNPDPNAKPLASWR